MANLCPDCGVSLVPTHREKHKHSSLDIFECDSCGYVQFKMRVGAWELGMEGSPNEPNSLTPARVLCKKGRN